MEFVNLVKGFDALKKRTKNNDDSFVDRLNHRYTVVIIIIFSAVVTLSQYGGKPIKCWVPGHFTGGYGEYADNICWVSNTYNVPIHEDLPPNEQERKVKMLKYYQWTPFILLFQALLFYFPRMIWRSLSDKSGLDLQSIVSAVHKFQTDASSYADRKKIIDYLVNIFGNYVESAPRARNKLAARRRQQFERLNKGDVSVPIESKDNQSEDYDEKKSIAKYASDDELPYDDDAPPQKAKLAHYGKICCVTKGKRYGNYLLALFLFVKILYLVNSFVQLFILNHFLGNNYLILGAEVIGKIWNGEDWAQSERFPRVTMCDFKIREVGIVHRYTVQCVLQINLFNEKIFIFIWFWLCLVTIMNLVDLISWAYTLVCNKAQRYSYIKRRLLALKSPMQVHRLVRLEKDADRELFEEFVNKYLQEDGILALRLLSRNAHDLIVSEIVTGLYESYKAKRDIELAQYQSRRPAQNETVRQRSVQSQQEPPAVRIPKLQDS